MCVHLCADQHLYYNVPTLCLLCKAKCVGDGCGLHALGRIVLLVPDLGIQPPVLPTSPVLTCICVLRLFCCTGILQSHKLPWQMLVSAKHQMASADEALADKLRKDYQAWLQSAAVADAKAEIAALQVCRDMLCPACNMTYCCRSFLTST